MPLCDENVSKKVRRREERIAYLLKKTIYLIFSSGPVCQLFKIPACGARGSSIMNPQQQVAMIGFPPLLDGNWRTQGTL